MTENFDAFGLPLERTVGYRELRASGLSRHGLKVALHEGSLVRARRDVYLSAEVAPEILRAERVGGRLDCLSALQQMGVFVLSNSRLHVQVEPYDGRPRSPDSRGKKLASARRGTVAVHWRTLDLAPALHTVPVAHALAQAALCQPPRAMVASIDSALNKGLIVESELADVFESLPLRMQKLKSSVDGRAESGSESLARLMLRAFGRLVEVQKYIDGVGRVDLVIDGWIVVECDSREFHSGWSMQESDRERDLALACRGYVPIRPTARLIFERPEVLIAAVRGLLDLRRR